jgi:hypothetical protein
MGKEIEFPGTGHGAIVAFRQNRIQQGRQKSLLCLAQ